MTTLSDLLEYSNGLLLWKVDRGSQKCKGKVAGSDHDGYVRLRVSGYGGRMFAHNIIWNMFNGDIPLDMYVDHIDGNRSNNKIENLRLATRSDNLKNQKIHSNNSSGIKNVTWSKRHKKWMVSLSANKKRHHLGYYSDIELADLVASEARNTYHKQFAKHA